MMNITNEAKVFLELKIEDILKEIAEICKKNGVTKLVLIGSFAKGTNHRFSDIDIAVKCDDIMKLEDELNNVQTLRKIDVIDLDSRLNKYLLEDIEKYGKVLYQ